MRVEEAARLLLGWNDILILTHRRPDGDTIGCAVALCQWLREQGRRAHLLTNEEAHALFHPYLEGYLAPADFQPAHVVSVDIASLGLLPDSAAPYREQVELAIDHHPSNEGFGRYNWVDPSCAACGELIYRLVTQTGPVSRAVALPLYVAVSTDTGCFAYSNTSPQTHRVAADLMETGIDHQWVNKRHFRTKSYKRLQIESRIVQEMELFDGGATAVATVSLALVRELGATEEDLEDISSFVGQVEGVKNGVTLRELKPGECKFSLRTDRTLNASRVCGLLGGGGHAAAAGCTVYGTIAQAKSAMLDAIHQVQQEG
jgi:phosphoesterase RecJ-like protein